MGIFRAIGGSSQQLQWVNAELRNERQIFIIEVISNTIGSTISGVVIGVGIASLVSIQMNLLTEVPFSIYIPYWLLSGVFTLTVTLNIAASVLSINTIVKQPIAFIAKGGSFCSDCFTNDAQRFGMDGINSILLNSMHSCRMECSSCS